MSGGIPRLDLGNSTADFSDGNNVCNRLEDERPRS